MVTGSPVGAREGEDDLGVVEGAEGGVEDADLEAGDAGGGGVGIGFEGEGDPAGDIGDEPADDLPPGLVGVGTEGGILEAPAPGVADEEGGGASVAIALGGEGGPAGGAVESGGDEAGSGLEGLDEVERAGGGRVLRRDSSAARFSRRRAQGSSQPSRERSKRSGPAGARSEGFSRWTGSMAPTGVAR